MKRHPDHRFHGDIRDNDAGNTAADSASSRVLRAMIECHLSSAKILAAALRDIEEAAQRQTEVANAERRRRQLSKPPSKTPVPPPTRELVTVDEAMRLLKIGRTKVYDLIKKKRLRAVKIGTATRIPVSDIDALMNPQGVGASAF